jgi:phosphohistidine phosphatase
MILYLVRHAYAGEHGDPRYPDDSQRPLTKKGRKQFRRMVKHLTAARFLPEVIGTSPYVRAAQTAEVIADEATTQPDVQAVAAFEPGCNAAHVLAWANQVNRQAVAYVGHAPDIDHIADDLLGTSAGAIRFAKGAIAAIEFADVPAEKRGTLRWLVAPKLLTF